MSIVDFIEIKGKILASTLNGQLILWHLSKHLKDLKKDKTDCGLLQNEWKIKLQQKSQSLFGLMIVESQIYIASQNILFWFKQDKLIDGKSPSIQQEGASGRLRIEDLTFSNQEITSMLHLESEQLILIGTNQGILHYFSPKEKKIIKSIKIIEDQNNDINSFSVSSTKNQAITSMLLYRDQTLILIGNSAGRLLIFSRTENSIVLQLNAGTTFQPIKQVIKDKEQLHFYVLHESYITCWNLRIGHCLWYYKYSNPTSLCTIDDKFIISGPYSQLCILKTDQHEKEATLIKTTLRGIQKMKILILNQEMIAVGGSDLFIQVFLKGMRVVTMYSK